MKQGNGQILLCDTRNSSHTTRTAALQAVDQTALSHIGKACEVGTEYSGQEVLTGIQASLLKKGPGRGSNQVTDKPKVESGLLSPHPRPWPSLYRVFLVLSSSSGILGTQGPLSRCAVYLPPQPAWRGAPYKEGLIDMTQRKVESSVETDHLF